jgi:hypothetical protein
LPIFYICNTIAHSSMYGHKTYKTIQTTPLSNENVQYYKSNYQMKSDVINVKYIINGFYHVLHLRPEILRFLPLKCQQQILSKRNCSNIDELKVSLILCIKISSSYLKDNLISKTCIENLFHSIHLSHLICELVRVGPTSSIYTSLVATR